MMLSLIFQEKREEGREDGKERTRLLIRKLINSGRLNDLQDISSDKESWNKAFDEFSLTPDYSETGES